MNSDWDDISDNSRYYRDPIEETHVTPHSDSYLDHLDQEETPFVPEPSRASGPSRPAIIALILCSCLVLALIGISLHNTDRPRSHRVPTPEPAVPRVEQPPVLPTGYIQQTLQALVFILAQNNEFSGASGTGFLVSGGRYIVSNYHVVEDGRSIECVDVEGRRSGARILAHSADLDLVVLQTVERLGSHSLNLAARDEIQIGADVFVAGYPLGTKLGAEPSVASGIISSIRREADSDWIQIDAAVNSGNSGGPLVLKNSGRVAGVVTKKLRGDVEGIAFAIPASVVREFFTDHGIEMN